MGGQAISICTSPNLRNMEVKSLCIDLMPDRQIHGQTDRLTDRQIQGQTDRQIDRQTDAQTDTQADRQTDRNTDRQTNRHTDKKLHRETHRQTDTRTDIKYKVRNYEMNRTYRFLISIIGEIFFCKKAKFKNEN